MVEIDPDLVRTQGDFAMAYTRATFTVPQPVEGKPDVKQQSQLQLHAIDCAAGASTVVGVAVYAGPLRARRAHRTDDAPARGVEPAPGAARLARRGSRPPRLRRAVAARDEMILP